MKECIAADGPERFAKSAGYLARRAEVQEAVEAKYAAQLAEAGFFRRLLLRHAQRRELRRALSKIAPSAESCWLGVKAIQAGEGADSGLDQARTGTKDWFAVYMECPAAFDLPPRLKSFPANKLTGE